MRNLAGKKLLVLGGKPIGSKEIVVKAKEMGVYTIVADYLPKNESPAKLIADEAWDVSTADIDLLAQMAREANIDGVYTGVHEFNIVQMIKLCDILKTPCYCTIEQWETLENKENFKNACRKFNIPVTKEYHINNGNYDVVKEEDYPVITKPVDGSGSRGFAICNNVEELREAYKKAKEFSFSGDVLVESFMEYKYSVIINYTIVDGNIIYSGMSDKRSKKVFENGSPIMAFQFYPAEYENKYLETLNSNAIDMLKNLGLKNGVIWIEAFCKNGEFVFNELGYRFGGSLTYYPVQFYYGIDQLELQLEYALTGKNEKICADNKVHSDVYCILPTHVSPGKIASISGISELREKTYFQAYVPVHEVGDDIKNWGSAQQVLAYIHYVAKDRSDAKRIHNDIMNTLTVEDTDGNNLLFNLVDESVF